MKKLILAALAALMLASCQHADDKTKKDNDHYIPWWVKQEKAK